MHTIFACINKKLATPLFNLNSWSDHKKLRRTLVYNKVKIMIIMETQGMKRICLILTVVCFALSVFFFQKNALAIIQWVKTLGLLAPVVFIILYCLATLFFLPTMILTLAGGALFGPLLGVILNLIGATLGASFAFFISRFWIYSWFNARKNERINKLIIGVEQRGWKFVALLRLVPLIPFNLVNYGLGLTRIKFSHYAVTTFIFLIPAEIISTYCGYASIHLLLQSEEFQKRASLIFFIGLSLFLLVYRQLRHKPNVKAAEDQTY